MWYSQTPREARGRHRLVPIAGCAALTACLLPTSRAQRLKFLPWTDSSWTNPRTRAIHRSDNNRTLIASTAAATTDPAQTPPAHQPPPHTVVNGTTERASHTAGSFRTTAPRRDWIRSHQNPAHTTTDPILRTKRTLLAEADSSLPWHISLLASSPHQLCSPHYPRHTTGRLLAQRPHDWVQFTVDVTSPWRKPENPTPAGPFNHSTNRTKATIPGYHRLENLPQHDTYHTCLGSHYYPPTRPHFHTQCFTAHWATLHRNWQSTCTTNVDHIRSAGELRLLIEVNNTIRLKQN
ncbi:hypothetical protein DYB35_013071 [Aphanomyces astaci]|uniref:Uncharacterized protein n=1 Tax=Aphanomyces astaci TaxID=112090 RepID=A0A3R6XI59_APHAT|nr:hypothetical protein DYB35_013071 [Aphanomyces astaci]